MNSSNSGFIHRAAIYHSDEDFLAMALPFIVDGLDAGEPVLATTTPANLELIGTALGVRAERVDYAETAYFGRRPIQRVTAFHRYWKRHADAGNRRVRILAEPVWAGRSAAQIRAWQRMESGLNVVLADTGVYMICPYDARTVDPGILAGARRTHPEYISGSTAAACPDFADPVTFTGECDVAALPPPPARAAALRVDGGPRDLRALRRFVTAQTVALGMSEDRAALLVLAVSEAVKYLRNGQSGPMTARVWSEFGATVCELHRRGTPIADPVLGLRPPGPVPAPSDGIYLSRQICDRFEVRSFDDGCAIRMYAPGTHAEELVQSAIPYTR